MPGFPDQNVRISIIQIEPSEVDSKPRTWCVSRINEWTLSTLCMWETMCEIVEVKVLPRQNLSSILTSLFLCCPTFVSHFFDRNNVDLSFHAGFVVAHSHRCLALNAQELFRCVTRCNEKVIEADLS